MYYTHFPLHQLGQLELVPQRQLSGRETPRHFLDASLLPKHGPKRSAGFHQNGKDKGCVKKSASDLTFIESTINGHQQQNN
jgi:hypothetical protein